MNGKTIAESKAEYEASSLKQLMDANDHKICQRCYCCDSMWQSAPCFQCGGFEDEDDDIWSVCSACGDEGETFWEECLGRCDDEGHHKDGIGASHSQSGNAASGEGPTAPADGQATS
jgi:hypothetical protein